MVVLAAPGEVRPSPSFLPNGEVVDPFYRDCEVRIGMLELVYFGYVSTYSNAQIPYRGSHLQRAFLTMLQAATRVFRVSHGKRRAHPTRVA